MHQAVDGLEAAWVRAMIADHPVSVETPDWSVAKFSANEARPR
jgi:hypothetical protein